jgi:dethiobiotin synthetase
LDGTTIDVESLREIAVRQPGEHAWIVEGAGGVLVPLNDDELLVDLIRKLELPALVVSRSGLGTINHTLLTIEALRRRQIAVAGIVMVGPPNDGNRQALEHYGRAHVVAEMPMLSPLEPEPLHQWTDSAFDRDGCLMRHLA